VLLVLLRDPSDPVTWGAFVACYGPKVHGRCRKWGLQEAGAQDVTRDVLMRLVDKLRSFRYDPDRGTFRGWLKTLTHHAWSDYLESEGHHGTGTGIPGYRILGNRVER
jgi:RNA polymerase sigma-70 factor (ECF subfamily)